MPAKQRPTRSREEVRADFERHGISIRSWALKHRVDPVIAAHVLAGRLEGRYGEAHRAAVLLGIKNGVVKEAA